MSASLPLAMRFIWQHKPVFSMCTLVPICPPLLLTRYICVSSCQSKWRCRQPAVLHHVGLGKVQDAKRDLGPGMQPWEVGLSCPNVGACMWMAALPAGPKTLPAAHPLRRSTQRLSHWLFSMVCFSNPSPLPVGHGQQ